MSLAHYGAGGGSPWGALAYNMATNKRFHRFVGKVGKGAYRAGRAVYNATQKRRSAIKNRAGRISNVRAAFSRATVAPGSASHGGTQRFGSSRGRKRPYLRKGKGTKKYGRKRRRGGGSGKSMKYLLKMLTTPQITKYTRADAFPSAGSGLRSWSAVLLNSKNQLGDMWDRRPGVFFSNVETDPATASTQTAFSTSHKCHLRGIYNKLVLQNRSNWDMELKIYECVLRRDKGRTLSGTAQAWVLDLFSKSDSNIENKGEGQPGYAGGADLLTKVYQNPTYTPYMSNYFCETMRIVKTTSYKIGMNDYITYFAKCNGKQFSGPDLSNNTDQAGFPELIGGWSKVLLFSWIGGPVDNEVVGAGGAQSKAICDLFMQLDVSQKFWFEPRAQNMYNISSSNTTTAQLGYDATNKYSTTPNALYVVPATQVSQSIVGDDTANLHP